MLEEQQVCKGRENGRQDGPRIQRALFLSALSPVSLHGLTEVARRVSVPHLDSTGRCLRREVHGCEPGPKRRAWVDSPELQQALLEAALCLEGLRQG